MNVTAYDIALRYVGQKEIKGTKDNPFILWCYSLCDNSSWAVHDEVPWCSAFLQHPFWELRLWRSKNLMARSWLKGGTPIPLVEAKPGFDVVIFKNADDHPGPEVTNFQGHVALFAGLEAGMVLVLGGNQHDEVSLAHFPRSRVLGVRRLAGGI